MRVALALLALATLALNSLIGAGVPQDWATHMIGHELTVLYGIDHARTRSFFEGLGIPTRLSGHGLGREAVDAVVAQLTAHGMVKLGERRSITPDVSRAILEAAL